MNEPFLVGMLVGFVLGAILVGFFWNESVKGEND